MVPELDFSSDSDDDLEMLLLFPHPSAGLFSKKKETDEDSNLKLKTLDGKVVEISTEETSSATSSGALIPEIDLSSDSEDDLELEIIARKLFMPNKGTVLGRRKVSPQGPDRLFKVLNPRKEAFTLPKITESKLDKEIQGKKYFKSK